MPPQPGVASCRRAVVLAQIPVIADEAFHWALGDDGHLVAFLAQRFSEFILKMVCHRAYGEDRLVLGISMKIVADEVAESIRQELADGRFVAILGQERCEAGQEAVGQGTAIDLVDDFLLSQLRLVGECDADVRRQQFLEHSVEQLAAQIGAAAFIAQHVAQCRSVAGDLLSVVVT